MWRLPGLALVGLLLGGCSWVNSYFLGTDNSIPPSPLQPLSQPQPVHELWHSSISSGSGATFSALAPALASGHLFVAGHDGDFHALDAVSGQSLWHTDTGLPIAAGVGVGDGLVFAGTSDGQVVALTQSGGKERWRAQVASEVLTAPVEADGVVVIRTVDGTFTGLSASDGSQLWAYDTTLPVLTLRGASKPLIANGTMIAGLDSGQLLLLNLKTGTLIGERRIASPSGRTEVERLDDIDATMKRVGNTLYAAAYQNDVIAVDLRSGAIQWAHKLSSDSGIDVAAGQLFVTDTDGIVWALDARDGHTLWQQDALRGRRLTAPVVVDGDVVVGDYQGYLHWLDTGNGQIVARIQSDGDGLSSTPLLVDGVLYVLGRSGKVYAFAAKPGAAGS